MKACLLKFQDFFGGQIDIVHFLVMLLSIVGSLERPFAQSTREQSRTFQMLSHDMISDVARVRALVATLLTHEFSSRLAEEETLDLSCDLTRP